MTTNLKPVRQNVDPSELVSLGPTNHQWMLLTKETVQKLYDNYLASNHRNRNVDKKYVQQYSEDMKNNRWKKVDNTPILIDKDFNLRGGQHRVLAFLKSGMKEITLPVVYPASEEEIEMQDTIKARTKINTSEMMMSNATYDAINNLILSPRTIHTAAKLLVWADNHPGFDDKDKVIMVGKDGKKFGGSTFPISNSEIITSINKYLSIFRELEDCIFLDGKSNREGNFAAFGPFTAAFVKAHTLMSKSTWKSLARLLTDQNLSPFVPGSNVRLAAEELVNVFINKGEQNNPNSSDKDMRLALSCLAAAHNDVDIKTIDMDKYGYETFLK